MTSERESVVPVPSPSAVPANHLRKLFDGKGVACGSPEALAQQRMIADAMASGLAMGRALAERYAEPVDFVELALAGGHWCVGRPTR
ncbi:MAG: hypothetical protein NTV86_19350 [Planctomycetota bacterium]|nr:hypothetical protein [Planctomycetota bacterium]